MTRTILSYKVESHHEMKEKDFALVKLKLLGFATGKAHPADWHFEMIVPKPELNEWELGSFKKIDFIGASK